MVDVADLKKNIQVESVQYRSSISESTGFALAGSINFINNRQYDKHSFNLNLDYSQFSLSQLGDGIFPIQENMEIVGYALYSGISGTSGTTTVDLRLIDTDGTDNGSVFTTKPAVDFNSSDNSFSHVNLRDNAQEIPTGHTQAVFSQTTFNRFDGLRMVIDEVMLGAQNLQFTIFFRPI